jgi:16S rRNA A1518/A1519 N6-dimethyltransferase RsmA/KsgA/DIM1 with predicted DNA glycosylase/AP lyase activity
LHNGDVFTSSPSFDVLVSSLPYSESSRFIEWLSLRKYNRAVVLLQYDFAKKITATPSSPEYRAVSVVSQASAHLEIISQVSRLEFDPPPRVNSALVRMRWRKTLTSGEVAMIKRIFSQKRRTVKAALKNLGLIGPASASSSPEHEYLQCRVNSLRPDSVIAMIGVLARSESKGKSPEGGLP